ncbi:hypothetical protein BV898_08763 [Hypsibius exemplaris]|uniref:G-protein coupled receptors family 1 profile domain-containing protein n=1 Tax=Hypsibius exemplaris TaxID=2072580 RepID=A0A1W0WPQ3_HYPEX|nr:hypothetical protein BV898_08763 [Hypsibius exemplaris]
MDDLTKKYIEMIFYTYIIRVVCAIGIFGNLAILVVLSRRGAKETAFVYIRALAAVDLIICVSLLGLGFVRCGEDCSYLSPTARYWGKIYEAFIYLPIGNAGQMSNLFITMAMTIHRVASVIQIRKASHDGCALRINVRRSRNLARRLVIIIIIFSVSVNVIRFFFYTVQEAPIADPLPEKTAIPSTYRHHQGKVGLTTLPALPLRLASSLRLGDHVITNNDSAATATPNRASILGLPQWNSQNFVYFSNFTNGPGTLGEPAGNREYELVGEDAERDVRYTLVETDFYKGIITSFLYALSALHFGELIVLTTVNLILIRILRLSKQQRKNLIRGEIQQRKRRDGDDVTRMLIITVLVHIVCHLHSPFSAPKIAETVFGVDYIKSASYGVQLAVNNTLTLTSHAITFFLYLVSRKFRKQVSRTWDCIIHHVKRRAKAPQTPNHSWTPSYAKGGASPILHRQSSGNIRFL